MSDSVWSLPLGGTNLAVLAGCRVRDGAPLPAALPPRLQGVDLIVTLGDRGDRSALDQLQEIAPVLGVRAPHDPDDPRARRAALVLSGEGYRIGCVHDARAAGLTASVDPSALNPGSPAWPAPGAEPTFLRLKVTAEGCFGQIVWAV